MPQKSRTLKQKFFLLITALFLFSSYLQYATPILNAAALTFTSVRFNRMKAATVTTFRLTFTVPAGNTGTEDKVKINFPDSYTIATTTVTANGACNFRR